MQEPLATLTFLSRRFFSSEPNHISVSIVLCLSNSFLFCDQLWRESVFQAFYQWALLSYLIGRWKSIVFPFGYVGCNSWACFSLPYRFRCIFYVFFIYPTGNHRAVCTLTLLGNTDCVTSFSAQCLGPHDGSVLQVRTALGSHDLRQIFSETMFIISLMKLELFCCSALGDCSCKAFTSFFGAFRGFLRGSREHGPKNDSEKDGPV